MDPPGRVLGFSQDVINLNDFIFEDSWGNKGTGSIEIKSNGLLYLYIEASEGSDLTMVGNLYDEDLLLEDYNGNQNIYNVKGEELYGEKRYIEAEELFQVLSDTYPDNQRAVGNRIICLIKLQNYDRAISLCKDLLETDLTNSKRGSTLYNLGLAQEKKGDLISALDSYKKSVKIRPNKVVQSKIESLGKNQ